MRVLVSASVAAAALLGALVLAQDQPPAADPTIRAAVEQFYATQEAEDVDGYLALWSRHAQRPRPEQLKFIFESGDDRFTGITLRRVEQSTDLAHVRVSATRHRTIAGMPPGPAALRVTAIAAALTFVREDGSWKLLREGSWADEIAASLIAAASSEERAQILASEPGVVGRALVDALARRATDAAQRRAYEDAEAILNIVLDIARQTGDRAAEGETLQNLANAFYFRGRFAEALASYEARLAIERDRKHAGAIALALVGIATVRYVFAEYSPSIAAYREALVLQEQLGDEAAVATTLISTGNIQYMQGDYEAAIRDYRQSLALSRKTFNLDAQSRALEGLGRVFGAQGDFGGALAAFTDMLADAKRRSDRSRQGTALQHIGEVQLKLGNVDEARASFEASRTHYQALNDTPNVGRLWQAIALTDLVAARFPLAEKEYTTGIAVCSGARDDECVARATVGLAFAQAAQDKYTEAIASYAKAIAAFTALDMREEAARAEVGSSQAFAGKGDLDAALAAAGRARQSAVAIDSEDVLWRALLAEARVLRRQGDAAALGAARAAVAAVERIQQSATERPGTLAPADGDEAFATLSVVQAEAGDARTSLATAEQMRLYRLRTTLAPNEREIARGMTAEEREEERAAAAELVSLGAQLTRERSLAKPDPARVDRLEKAQADAIARRTAQQERLFQRLPELRSWRALGQPADATTLERLLADHDVFVQFVVDEDDLLTLLATRSDAGVALSAYVTRSSRRALAERVGALMTPALLRSAVDWKRNASEFARTLPSDVLVALSKSSKAIVVPDGPLWRVPFEALPTSSGYIADSASLTYAASITASLQLREVMAPRVTRPFVAIAAPDIATSVKARALSTAPAWTLRTPDDGRKEVARLSTNENASENESSPALILSGADATESGVRAHAGEGRVLHIAAPFRVNAASPLFSPLLLGGAGAESADDGVLEAREVMNLDLSATVAVLSDGSALSMRDAARALDVIEWAWRAAGVRSLLVRRWMPDAPMAGALLPEFHQRIAEGAAGAEALRAAAAKVRAGETTAAPFYWAGWIAIGARVQDAPAAR